MCQLYTFGGNPNEVKFSPFGVTRIMPTREQIAALHNIAPKMFAPVIFQEKSDRFFDMSYWSLVAPWSKELISEFSTYNARDDGLMDSKLFAPAFRERRCIVPASGFYEFKKRKSSVQCFYLFRADDSPLAFAGLWGTWKNPENGDILRSFTIVTTGPNAILQPIHHRMPVVLDLNDYAEWLDPKNKDTDSLFRLLKPCPDDWLVARPVDLEVKPVPKPRKTPVVGETLDLF